MAQWSRSQLRSRPADSFRADTATIGRLTATLHFAPSAFSRSEDSFQFTGEAESGVARVAARARLGAECARSSSKLAKSSGGREGRGV